MKASEAVPLLVIAVLVFALAKYQGVKVWAGALLLAAGIYIGLDPLTGQRVSRFLSQVTNGRFP